MKKILLGTLMLPFLWITACKKSDNIKSSTNRWTINGNTYYVKTAKCMNSGFYATDTFSNRANAFFQHLPIVDGIYDIVSDSIYPLAANQAVLEYQAAPGAYYRTMGTTNKKLVVRFTGGKMSISFSGVYVTNQYSGDSLLFSGNMVQTQ